MPQAPLEKNGHLSDKVTRSIFFLSAVLFHLVLFMALASYVIWRTPPQQPDPGIVYIPTTQQTPPVPPRDPNPAPSISSSSPDYSKIISAQDSSINIRVPSFSDSSNAGHIPPYNGPPKIPVDGSTPDIRTPALIDTLTNKWHMTRDQILSHDPTCTFPVYVASYADGDWACNLQLDKEGNIEAGSIPNLVAKINEWSHSQIKGNVIPKPLNIASPELLDKMPPFVFFTGHKDFTLTEAEVANLREYLFRGGLVWGDNALAGGGSRFDVAFRREMKRVIPDKDINFVPYSVADDIFNKGRYPLSEIPAGMNYSAEAPEHLDIGGILAILYTPNDYSDMMFMRINPGDTSFFMTYLRIPPGTLYTKTAFVEKQSSFYRNFNLKSSLAVHKLGMNIVTYLLTRFDDKVQLAP